MKRIHLLMVASALSLIFALALLAIWAITQAHRGYIPSQGYSLSTKGGWFEFYVAAGQIKIPGIPTPSMTYRRVLSFPLWPAIGGGLVLPINCAWYLIVTRKPRATRGFEVIEAAPRPPASPAFAVDGPASRR